MRSSRPLLAPLVLVAALLASGLGLLFLQPAQDDGALEATQLPIGGTTGEEQLAAAVHDVMNAKAAAQGTAQRALQESVKEAFLDAIPDDAPQPLPTYTAAVKTIFGGALDGSTSEVAAGLTSLERDGVEAVMEGLALQVFAQLPANPSTTQSVLMADVGEGFAEGAALGVHGHVTQRLVDYTTWAQEVGRHAMDWTSGTYGSAPPAPLGSQGDAVAGAVGGAVGGALSGFPDAPVAEQVEALGEYVGYLVVWVPGAILEDFPPAPGTPLVSAVEGWARGLAEGGVDGLPPKPEPENLSRFLTWTRTFAEDAPGLLADHDFTPTNQGIAFLQNWSAGLVRDAPRHVGAAQNHSGMVHRDLEAYAGALVADVGSLAENASAWPDQRVRAAGAWAEALTAGASRLGATAREDLADPMEAWARRLAGAVLDFPDLPADEGLRGLAAWGEGAATSGVEAIQRNAGTVAQPPPAGFVDAVADGVGEGARIILEQAPHIDPEDARAFAEGLAAGSFDPADPVGTARWGVEKLGYVNAWLNGTVNGALPPIADRPYGTLQEWEAALRAAGKAIAEAGYSYAENRTLAGARAATNLSLGWGKGTAEGAVTALGEAINRTFEDLDPGELDPENSTFPNRLLNYTINVTGVALSAPIDLDRGDRTLTEAGNFSRLLMEPLAWFLTVDDDGEVHVNDTYDGAINAFVNNFRDHSDPSRFTDPRYQDGALAIVNGFAAGLAQGLEAVPHFEQQKNLTEAWARGVADGIVRAPLPGVNWDRDAWVAWANHTAMGAAGAALEGTEAQRRVVSAFANQTVQWAANMSENPPRPQDPRLPLVNWTVAYVNGTIARIPDLRPGADAQVNATLQWAGGAAYAITHPPLPPEGWDQEQVDAVTAYVGGVSGAVGAFVNATYAWTQNPNGSDPGDPPSGAILAHAMEVLAAGDPAGEHVDEIGVWANATAWGIARMGTDAAEARRAGASDFANYTVLGLDGIVNLTTDEQAAILGAWADGVIEGIENISDIHYQPNLPAVPDLPDDPTDEHQMNAFLEAVLRTPRWILEQPLLPDLPIDGKTQRARALANHVVFGGGGAILNATDVTLRNNQGVEKRVEAYAGNLTARAMATLVNATVMDAEAMGRYMEGAAYQGIDRILRTRNVSEETARLVGLWAGELGNLTTDYVFNNVTGNQSGEEPTWAAYGRALANATLDLPLGPTQRQLGATLLWVGVVRDAAANLTLQPTLDNAELVRRWVEAEVEGFTDELPSPDDLNTTQDTPEAAAWQRWAGSMAAWLDGFTTSGLWELPRIAPPPDPRDDLAWVKASVDAAMATSCQDAAPATCAYAEGIVGEATGDVVAMLFEDDTNGAPPSGGSGGGPGSNGAGPHDPATHEAFVEGVLQAVEAGSDDRAALVGAVRGAAQAIVEAPPGGMSPEQARASAEAAIGAVGAHAGELAGKDPAGLAEDLAQAITAGLPAVPGAPAPDRFPVWAEGIVQAAVADLAAKGVALPTDPMARKAEVERLVMGYVQGAGQGQSGLAALVEVDVTDGANGASGSALDGEPSLDGAQAHTVTVAVPPVADAPGAAWSVLYAVGGFTTSNAGEQLPLAPAPGGYRAAIPAAAFAGAAEQAEVALVVLRTVSGQAPVRFDNDGEPYAYQLDMGAPTFQLSAPATSSASPFPVAWSGSDAGSGIAGYTIEVRKDGGAWQTLLEDTAATSFSFTGQPGAAYDFRGFAEDGVGRASPVATARTLVPAGTTPPGGGNAAPTLAFVAPPGSAVRGQVQVALAASDPQGTAPAIVVALVPDAGGAASTVFSGVALSFPLDTTKVADGAYRLRATASDGDLHTTVTSARFVIDNTAPVLEGPKPAGGPEGGVLLVAWADQAELVQVKLAPESAPSRAQSYLMRDDGQRGDGSAGDGLYSVAVYGLPPGAYLATVSAVDAAGNTLERQLALQVENTPVGGVQAPPLGAPVGGPVRSGAAPPAAPAAKGLFGLPGFEATAALAALGAALVAARRRKP